MTYTSDNTNGWRNLPGPGDEETWGPCLNHPNDPRTPDDSAELEDRKEEMIDERLADIRGYFVEALTEYDDAALEKASDLIRQWNGLSSDKARDLELAVGQLFCRLAVEHCTPDDDEVREALSEW